MPIESWKNIRTYKGYMEVSKMPPFSNIKIGMPSAEVFRIMGKLTDINMSTYRYFDPYNPERDMNRNYIVIEEFIPDLENDSTLTLNETNQLLRCLLSWKYYIHDKKSQTLLLLNVQVRLSKPPRKMPSGSLLQPLGNPLIKGEDSGWVVDDFNIEYEGKANFTTADYWLAKLDELQKRLPSPYPFVYYDLGNVYSKLGKTKEAKEHWLKAIELIKKINLKNEELENKIKTSLNSVERNNL
jgi:tetratricopeptide (TPR) repeat protein